MMISGVQDAGTGEASPAVPRAEIQIAGREDDLSRVLVHW